MKERIGDNIGILNFLGMDADGTFSQLRSLFINFIILSINTFNRKKCEYKVNYLMRKCYRSLCSYSILIIYKTLNLK